MPIKYRIVPSKLSTNPDGYVAKVQSYRTVTLDEVAEEISTRGTTASKPDILSILLHFGHLVEETLRNGEIVNTPLGSWCVAIRGTFTDRSDTFDPGRHRLVVRFIPSRRLSGAVREVLPEKHDGPAAGPRPVSYIDVASAERNGTVTPNDQGRLIGADLRFDPADPRQGIFFVDGNGVETRVRSVALNKPRQLVLLVPDLAAGRYRLEVRNTSGESQELRSGTLGHLLTVH